MRQYLVFLLTALLTCSVQAAPALYSASAKAQGAPFEMVVKEVKREPNKSYLSVPGFHQRSAPASRWLMCAYTDLAVKRGFTHWFVAYPPENSEILIVGLTNSPNASAIEVLGQDYRSDQTLGNKPMPVDKMFQMCGKRP